MKEWDVPHGKMRVVGKTKVELVFDTEKAADVFTGWFLDGGGEQEFDQSMEIHGGEDE